LLLELLISTAIKSYDNSRIFVRRVPMPNLRRNTSNNSSSSNISHGGGYGGKTVGIAFSRASSIQYSNAAPSVPSYIGEGRDNNRESVYSDHDIYQQERDLYGHGDLYEWNSYQRGAGRGTRESNGRGQSREHIERIADMEEITPILRGDSIATYQSGVRLI
jgi:hypothetical protein